MSTEETEIQITETPLVEQTDALVPIELTEEQEKLFDQYCDLRKVLDPKEAALKMAQKEFKPIDEAFRVELDKLLAAGEARVIQTAKYRVDAGKRGLQLSITDKKKLIDLMGLGVFLECATVTVENMEKYLTPDEMALCTKREPKTKRPVKWIKK